CQTIAKEHLHLPGPDFIDRVWVDSDRSPVVLRNLQTLFDHGRLAGTGYVSILPVDQGIEHSAGGSFAPNPIYFDPENIVKLAIEADIRKQKPPQINGADLAFNTKERPYGKTDKRISSELSSDHPTDLTRYQLANCYMGRAGRINPGGVSSGEGDTKEAVKTA